MRSNDYRLTPQRRAVLKVMSASEGHLAPQSIYERVRKKHAIGLVTVYRTLEILVGLGLVCEVYSGDRQKRYVMRRPSEHHHHLVCSRCGRVVDFGRCDLGELERRLSRETGFMIADHLLEFTGLCHRCQ